MRESLKLVVLWLLRAYKWAISPMFPPACRYVPTCSEYAMEAVERFGAARGGWIGLMRLLRCHPFARGGYDPVAQGLRRDNTLGRNERLEGAPFQNKIKIPTSRKGREKWGTRFFLCLRGANLREL